MKKIMVSCISIGLLLTASIASVNAVESTEQLKPSIESFVPFAYIYINNDAEPGGDGSYGHPFQNIQDGIDAATDGDVVFVFNGVYYENVKINKSLTLLGEESDSVIINGGRLGNTLDISASSVTIKKITVVASGTTIFEWGINVWSRDLDTYLSNIEISNCIIKYNRGGIHFQNISEITLKNCHINNNYGSGIFFGNDPAGDVLIDNCMINDNGGVGIFIVMEYYPQSDLSTYIGITNCDIFNNLGNGIQTITKNSYRLIDSLEIYNNNICRNKNAGVALGGVKRLQVFHNNICENGFIGAFINDEFNLNKFSSVYKNTISNNGFDTYIPFHGGIMLQECSNNVYIKNNIISLNSGYGIFLINAFNNNIIENNFIDNEYSSSFLYDYKPYGNTWDGNYWDKPRYLPKAILGVIFNEKIGFIPWVEFDFHPAKEPYDI